MNIGFVVATTKAAKSLSTIMKADQNKPIAAKNVGNYSLNEKVKTGLFGAAAVILCAQQATVIVRVGLRYDFLIFKITKENRRCIERDPYRCWQPMGFIPVARHSVNRAGKRTRCFRLTLGSYTLRCRASRFLAE